MNMLMTTVGAVYDTTDSALHVMADALLKRVEGTGINLLVLRREGTTLEATVDDSQADEPLCPMAFAGVVRKLSYDLLGEVWDGLLEFAALPVLTYVLTPTMPASEAAVLARVA